MPELRSKKSAAKATSTVKASSKRKAADNEVASPIAPKKVKEDTEPKKTKRSTSTSKSKKEKPVVVEQENQENEASEAEDDNEPTEGDEEAQALAKIVDSDAEEDDTPTNEEIQELNLPEVPDKVANPIESEDSEPGVVYVGRIPRGFYEHQMREYFTQFGQVNKIRMSRNKATGQSKHFAFIEFAELPVAEIVAKTMDNYLLAGHILKVKMVPKSQIHEKLWVGANKRFKQIPWNKMAGNKLKKPLTESGWTARITKEEEKRNERATKLAALGYEFEAPKLKTIQDVNNETPALEAAVEEAPEEIEAAPEPETVKPSKEEKTAKKPAKKVAGKTSKKTKKAKISA